MITIDDLTKYFGYYMSNEEFQMDLKRILINPKRYDSKTLYQVCKTSKIEIGFTNERMIREEDHNKPIMGGRPIFTHFNIRPQSDNLFEKLPFGVSFNDRRNNVREKAGAPIKTIDQVMPILGVSKSDHYVIGNIKIIFEYNTDNDSILFIQVAQYEKTINDKSKPAHNKQ